MTGLYDHQGVLRFAGRDAADCLAYADLFGLAAGAYCLASLAPMSMEQMSMEPMSTGWAVALSPVGAAPIGPDPRRSS